MSEPHAPHDSNAPGDPEGSHDADDHEPTGDAVAPERSLVAEARQAIEAILMVSDQPVEPALLAQLLEISQDQVDEICSDLAAAYEADRRGYVLAKVAGGYRFQSHPDMAHYVERFVLEGQSSRLSAAALETLAIIAYKQPISRMQVSAIRGVNVDGVVRTLEQRGFITEADRDPGPGNAVLFGTTDLFLERLGIDSVKDLPPLADYVPSADIVEQLETTLRPSDDDPRVDDDAPAVEPTGDNVAGAESTADTVAGAKDASAEDGRQEHAEGEAVDSEQADSEEVPADSVESEADVDADVDGEARVDVDVDVDADVDADADADVEVDVEAELAEAALAATDGVEAGPPTYVDAEVVPDHDEIVLTNADELAALTQDSELSDDAAGDEDTAELSDDADGDEDAAELSDDAAGDQDDEVVIDLVALEAEDAARAAAEGSGDPEATDLISGGTDGAVVDLVGAAEGAEATDVLVVTDQVVTDQTVTEEGEVAASDAAGFRPGPQASAQTTTSQEAARHPETHEGPTTGGSSGGEEAVGHSAQRPPAAHKATGPAADPGQSVGLGVNAPADEARTDHPDRSEEHGELAQEAEEDVTSPNDGQPADDADVLDIPAAEVDPNAPERYGPDEEGPWEPPTAEVEEAAEPAVPQPALDEVPEVDVEGEYWDVEDEAGSGGNDSASAEALLAADPIDQSDGEELLGTTDAEVIDLRDHRRVEDPEPQNPGT